MSSKTFILEEVINRMKKQPRSTGSIYRNFKTQIDELVPLGRTNGEKLYMLKEGLEEIPLCVCGEPMEFYRFANGYHKSCGKKECVDEIKNFHAKENCMKKYGVTNNAQRPDVIKKTKETNLAKYGVTCTMQAPLIKEQIKLTCIEKYGFEKVLKNKEIHKKQQQTTIDRHGTLNMFGLEKTKNTMNDLYGGCNAMDSFELRKKSGDKQSRNKYFIFIEKLRKETNKTILSHNSGATVFHLECQKCGKKFHVGRGSINSHIFHNDDMCTKCNPINRYRSKLEIEMHDFIKSICSYEIFPNKRIHLMEIDTYIQDLNLGFEFNGVYWHSSVHKDKSYHINKFNHFKILGINLIQIWEDDWLQKNDMIKNYIRRIILKKEVDFKYEFKEVSTAITKVFEGEHHIKGYKISKNHLALMKDDLILAMISYDIKGDKCIIGRITNSNEYDCTEILIQKLKELRVSSIEYSHSSDLGKFEMSGFEEVSFIKPDFQILCGKWRINRVLVKLKEFSEDERKEMKKIFDCGKIVYGMKL